MVSTPFDLTGRTAVVTGANTGIGQGIALALAAAGADIAAVGRSAADETAEQVRALGRRCELVSADLSSIEPVTEVVDTVVAKFGRLDILVNNAGIIRREDALDFSEADWDAVMDTNLKTLFFLCQAAARHMTGWASQDGERGKIVNVASLLSFQGGIRVPSYTASKSGVGGLTKLMANEWAPRGINVNAIAPAISRPTTPPRCRPMKRATGRSSNAYPNSAGATRPTSAARRSSSPAAPPITCRAISSP